MADHPHMLSEPIEIDYEALPEDASIAAHLSAGAFAGIMEHTVMFPIDSIKTRMQMIALGQPLSKSVIGSISKISSSEGAYALWRGVSSVVLGAGPAHAVYFSVFEATKTMLVNRLTNSRSTKIVTDESHPWLPPGLVLQPQSPQMPWWPPLMCWSRECSLVHPQPTRSSPNPNQPD